jgi:hypothetical protein
MHQVVLLTALTATTGLFGGGGRQQRVQYYYYYPTYSYRATAPVAPTPCASGTCQQTVATVPATPAQQPLQAANPPQSTQVVNQPQYTQPAYYYYPATSCQTTNGVRR